MRPLDNACLAITKTLPGRCHGMHRGPPALMMETHTLIATQAQGDHVASISSWWFFHRTVALACAAA